jgi:polygalacturonase
MNNNKAKNSQMIFSQKENIYQREIDVPTYKDFGNIYEGDYYKDIPFEEYIDTSVSIPHGDYVFDIRDYGAVGDGETLDTDAFMKAVSACEKAGGGTVLIKGGTYCIGTVYFCDNMTLFIASDATIIGSKNCSNYDGALVRGSNVNNVTITGGGKIAGSGEWFVYEPRQKPLLKPLSASYLTKRGTSDLELPENSLRYNYRCRIRYAEDKYEEGIPEIPRPDFMVWFEKCKNVKINNVILEDAMAWTLNLDTCDKVVVKDVVINNNRHVANTDGIDILGSNHVEINHCFISTADDGIVAKNPKHTGREMTDLYVTDCTILTVMNAFKIGTETYHDISHVVVENCRFCFPDIYPGTVSGISIESSDGSKVENVIVRNITMDKVTCPLFICLNMRNRDKILYSDDINSKYWGGTINNILIENIKATNVEVPSIITGFVNTKKDGSLITKAVTNVTVKDFYAEYKDNEEIVSVPDVIEEYVYQYPENNTFGDVDAYGIWVRHVENINLDNIDIKPRTMNKRQCIKVYK